MMSRAFHGKGIGNNPSRHNKFDNTADETAPQPGRPAVAHIGRTNPRSDVINLLRKRSLDGHRIVRSGIPYGPSYDLAQDENAAVNKLDRGLLFLSYQSSLKDGFRFVQKAWSNDPKFFLGNYCGIDVGLDPVPGQSNDAKYASLAVSNLLPNDASHSVSLQVSTSLSSSKEASISSCHRLKQ